MILTSPYATIVGLHNTARINARLAGNCKVFVTFHMKHVASSRTSAFVGRGRDLTFQVKQPQEHQACRFACRPSGNHFTETLEDLRKKLPNCTCVYPYTSTGSTILYVVCLCFFQDSTHLDAALKCPKKGRVGDFDMVANWVVY